MDEKLPAPATIAGDVEGEPVTVTVELRGSKFVATGVVGQMILTSDSIGGPRTVTLVITEASVTAHARTVGPDR